MKRQILAGLLVLALAGAVAASIAAFTTRSANAVESTVDIGAQWDPYAKDGSLSAATFQPNMSAATAIAQAKAYLKQRDNWDADKLQLPVRTTIGLFTGQTEDGGPWVTDLKARVVVFDNVPVPVFGVKQSEPYTGMMRFTMVLDDATGKFVYGTIIGVPR